MSEQTNPATTWLPRPFAAHAEVPDLAWPKTAAARGLMAPLDGEAPRPNAGDRALTSSRPVPRSARFGVPHTVHPSSPLAARRVALGLTQAAVGAACGVDYTAVSRWERGDRVPTTRRLAPLARALGVPPETVLSWFAA
jgi:DNA-binding XRE family transcriptional regulator